MKYIAPDAQGRSNLAAGRVQEAIGCCDKALAVDPRDPHAWFCKGSWLLGLGQVEEAYKCCDKALVIDPRHTDALFGRVVNLLAVIGTKTRLNATKKC